MSSGRSLIEHGRIGNYIDGEWRSSPNSDGIQIINPANGEEIGFVEFSTAKEVDDAVIAGKRAFEDWRSTPVEQRIQPLFRLKSLLEDHQEVLAEILVQDHGKTKREASGELRRGIENVEVACGIPSMMQAGFLENAAPNIDEVAIRQPLGVFTAITPFNFPGMIPLWFLPYAVATGNSFILKPSEQDPLVPKRIFELINDAGFPPGVVQLVNGGPDTVNALLEHPDITGVSFVGSSPVAKYVYETAAQHGKRVQAQGGAKNHIIVTESADLVFAAEQTVSSSFACAGERCLANDIALIEESVYDEFRTLVLDEVGRQVVGNGLNEETTIGALISEEHRDRVIELIETGIDEGATLSRDGRNVEDENLESGNFLHPTVFENVTGDMQISTEEIFGPVLGLCSIEDIREGIERINQSRFGNAASLFTGSGADARRFRYETKAGNVGVNVGTVAPMAFFHFGGRSESFFGDLHAQGEDMIHFFTDKTIYIERWR